MTENPGSPAPAIDVVPPTVQMVQLLAGFQVSQALYVVAKLSVPDALASGPRSVGDVAADVGAEPAALRRLLRVVAQFGVVTKTAAETYTLGPLGDTLRSEWPGSVRDLALTWMETHYAAFGELLHTARTGEPAAERHFGRPYFSWLGDHPEHVARFTGAMANLTLGIKSDAIAAWDPGAPTTIVDVGGADGSVLIQLLSRLPAANGIVLDLPHVVEAVTDTARAAGLEDRLTPQPGDFFVAVPPGDLYVLSMILHDWDDEAAGRILVNIRRDAPPGARVAALELVMPEGDEPHLARMVDLTMLGMLTGRERTASEHRRLLEESGFVFESVLPTPTPVSIVTARVP